MDNPVQLAYLTTQGRGMETDIPREWIDLVKNNLTDAFRRQDSEGYYTLDLAVMLAQGRGSCVGSVLRVVQRRSAMIAVTPSGLRFGATGEIYEAEIKRLDKNAYIFHGGTQFKKAV
jgi:hypothetical protein